MSAQDNGRPGQAGGWRDHDEPWREVWAAAHDAIRRGDHAEAADALLFAAMFDVHPSERAAHTAAANVCATQRLADKVEELTATLRQVTERNSEALERNTQATTAVAELRRDALRRVA